MLSGAGMRGPIVSAFGGNIGALWGRDGGSGDSRSGGARLLCAMCSGRKARVRGGRQMLEDLYAPGAVVSAMARMPKERRPDILFLSGKLGLSRHDAWAESYEARLSDEQASAWSRSEAMREQFANTLRRFQGGAVMVAAGGFYRQVFAAWFEALADDPRMAGIAVEWAPTQIGWMRQAVKRFAGGTNGGLRDEMGRTGVVVRKEPPPRALGDDRRARMEGRAGPDRL